MSGVNIIDSKWVFKVKKHVDGSIERYKAWMVAKGFKQWYGLDYEDTFGPVVKQTTIHLLMSLVVAKGWSLSLMFRMRFFMAFWKRKCI